ncbi:transporter substrate-binding domain-containing protein, partial [Desulfovibrio sp.]
MHFILTIVLTAALMLGITAPISQAMDLPQEVKNIVKRGQLRVGVKTDVPGFSVQDLSGNFQGMEVDIAKKLAMRMGLKANNIIYVPVTAKTRGQLVDSGDIDMVIATFTITEERKKTWNFSTPYY